MRRLLEIIVVIFCVAGCSKPEPRQLTLNEVNGDFKKWDLRRLEKIERDALNGDKEASYALVGYYMRYVSVDHEAGAKQSDYWAKNSLKLQDCMAVNYLHGMYSEGIAKKDSEGDGKKATDNNSKFEYDYYIRPDLKYVLYLEKTHAEWKCPDPLYPPGYSIKDTLRVFPDLKNSQ
jgi:hypothetical protein